MSTKTKAQAQLEALLELRAGLRRDVERWPELTSPEGRERLDAWLDDEEARAEAAVEQLTEEHADNEEEK